MLQPVPMVTVDSSISMARLNFLPVRTLDKVSARANGFQRHEYVMDGLSCSATQMLIRPCPRLPQLVPLSTKAKPIAKTNHIRLVLRLQEPGNSQP